MMRLIKFLLGLTVGAAAGVLLAPKSGRQLREQLFGGAAAKLLPPMAELYPLPERSLTELGDAATVQQPPLAAPSTEMVATPESIVEEPPAAVPETTGEDLLARIAATRAAVEAELAEPFGPASTEESAPAAEPPLYWELAPEAVAAEEPALEGREPEDLGVSEADQTAAVPIETAPSAASSETPPAEPVAEPVSEPIAEAEEPPTEIEPVAVVFEEPVPESIAEAEEPPTEIEPVAVVFEEPVSEPIAEAEEPPTEIEPVAVVFEEPVAVVFEEPVSEPIAEAEEAAAEVIADTVVTESAATVAGGAVDQAEMRRRIEETRARLKAKAFDAMMSGESALLRNDSGTRAVPASDGASLAPDVDSTIDVSLSPEDA